MTATAVPAQHIKVPRKFRGRYFKPRLLDHVNQAVYSLSAGHMFVLVAVATYWLLTQTIPPVTDHWNDLFPWAGYAWSALVHGHNPFAVPPHFAQSKPWVPTRHAIRDGIIEGELGGGALIMFFVNQLREPHVIDSRLRRLVLTLTGYTEQPDWFDKAACFLHIPNSHQTDRQGNPKRTTPLQLLFSPLSVLFSGLPGDLAGFGVFFGGPWLLHRLHVFLAGYGIAPDPASGNIATWENIGRGSFDAKMIGVLGLFFFGRRAIMKIGIDLQDTLSDVRAARIISARTRLGRLLARPPKFWPANYRAMVYSKVNRDNDQMTSYEIPRHGLLHRYLTVAFVLALPVMAWKGWDILAAAKQASGR